ncbi:VQ-like protein [Artemisia annua]|uniref:VQ-like protein n=1 Tax=Artemisia annua TaxID=35608 RepID=A0A2U1L434_ARTAN|nr:VQ-like protein [Artemisia annua]
MNTSAIKHKKNIARKTNKKQLKVVYISSPMKVRTSASCFRSLVQELTGRDSDISRYDAGYFDEQGDRSTTTSTSTQGGSLDACLNMEPFESTQLGVFNGLDAFPDDVFSSEMVDHLDGSFPSYSLIEKARHEDVKALPQAWTVDAT